MLLRHALDLTVLVSETVGVRVLIVNALDAAAASFYERFGFERSPTNPNDLMFTLADFKAS